MIEYKEIPIDKIEILKAVNCDFYPDWIVKSIEKIVKIAFQIMEEYEETSNYFGE